MQNLTLDSSVSTLTIQSYGAAGFRIGGVEYADTVLISSAGILPLPQLNVAEDIRAELFTALAASEVKPEILLIGTGAKHALLPQELKTALKAMGLPSIDAMATGAAARTFNVLLSEERRVAALLVKPKA